MVEARAIASTYRGCGGNTEAAMGVFGPTLSRKMDRGARTAGTMEECPACSRNPEFDIIVLRVSTMCRNIKTLFNFDPPVTDDEVRAASVQFIRKITGFNKPSKANEAAFLAAVEDVAAVAARLLRSLETVAPPKNREEEAAKARARAAERFGT